MPARALQVLFNSLEMLAEPVLVYQRAETLTGARARVAAIALDPAAGRAERDAVHPAIEPVAEDLARPSRIMLSELIAAGLLAIEVIGLPDAAEEDIADRAYCREVRMRWRNSSSPLARAARAWDNPAQWEKEATSRYDVVLVDPLSSVAAALNLDFDKSNAEFVRFYDRLVQPLAAAGLAVVLLDNIGHALEARTRAKGASAKQDRADLTFSCKLTAHPIALTITAAKVRTVRAPFRRGDTWHFDRETQRVERAGPQEPHPAETAFRPTILMERVSRALEEHPGLSKRAVRKTVKGKATAVDLGLDLLIADGHVRAEHDGQATKHHVERPYRETDDPHRVPVSQPCPDSVPDTVESDRVPVSPPLRARDAGHGPQDDQLELDRVPVEQRS